MTAARRPTTTALAVVVVGVLAALPLLLAAPAQASTYRYWTYWWAASNTGRSGGWGFSSVGPAGHRVNDTWVLGWRFSTTTSTTGGAKPRQSSDFATLCPSLAEPVAGKDRVALVVDYGTSSDAPPGQQPPTSSTARVECLTIASHPTGLAVLNAASVSIRSQDGLVCALDGYPRGECAPLVADPTTAPTASATAKPSPAPTRSSAAPVVPVTGRTTTPAPGTTAATPPPASAATSSGSAASQPGATASRSTEDSPSAEPSDEPTLQAASGAPSGASAPRAGPGSPVATVLGTLAVVALAGAAFWISRRRS